MRNREAEILWEDFLQAVEKAISKLSDETLAVINAITIVYFTKAEDENLYRSKVAEYDVFDEIVQYEEEDVCLGKRVMLQNALLDCKAKAEKDKNICSEWFEPENFENDGDQENRLDFILPKNLQ